VVGGIPPPVTLICANRPKRFILLFLKTRYTVKRDIPPMLAFLDDEAKPCLPTVIASTRFGTMTTPPRNKDTPS
jgi:hypothetical protein